MISWWLSQWKQRRIISFLLLAIATLILVTIWGQNQLQARESLFVPFKICQTSSGKLSPLKVHPLPTSLANWEDKDNSGDYFAQIKSTPVGYLIWSEFPVKVYLESIKDSEIDNASNRRWQQWLEAVRSAIAEWNLYLPLIEIENQELADIVIWRSPPPREARLNPKTGLYDISRAITAQTNYKFYINSENPPILSHRLEILIDPGLSKLSILAATRHELGHALGIWGHSREETDALYFSQVRDAPSISPRDINTLKKIYQQPTRLGWAIISDSLSRS